MKIVFANRSNCFTQRGGDTVQMEKTKEYLEKLYKDIEISIVTNTNELKIIQNIDIVHIFNIQTPNEALAFFYMAKEKGAKVVLSTIYWNLLTSTFIDYFSYIYPASINLPDFLKKWFIKLINLIVLLVPSLRKRFKNAINRGLYLSKRNKDFGRELLSKVDYILPNSLEEIEQIAKYFNIDVKSLQKKAICVPNAVEFSKIKSSEIIFNNKLEYINNLENIVVQAGRIEPLKNQLNLVKALKNNKDIPILLIGKATSQKYFSNIKKIAQKRGNVFFIEQVNQDILFKIFSKASVHVLASFRESPGLVSLEAKALGCEIVVSDEKYCPVKYYHFDKIAYICDPFSIKSIRNAILTALYHRKNTLDNKYKQFFCYENAARITYEAYKKLIVEN